MKGGLTGNSAASLQFGGIRFICRHFFFLFSELGSRANKGSGEQSRQKQSDAYAGKEDRCKSAGGKEQLRAARFFEEQIIFCFSLKRWL